MDLACACMLDARCFEENRTEVEQCWSMSACGQDMQDFARDHLPDVLPALRVLATSGDPIVRWQVYASASEGGGGVVDFLLKGLDDPDAYTRRRALLGLVGKPLDVAPIVDRFIVDEDPYLRQVTVDLAFRSGDERLCARVVEVLSQDNVDHVRRAAEVLRP